MYYINKYEKLEKLKNKSKIYIVNSKELSLLQNQKAKYYYLTNCYNLYTYKIPQNEFFFTKNNNNNNSKRTKKHSQTTNEQNNNNTLNEKLKNKEKDNIVVIKVVKNINNNNININENNSLQKIINNLRLEKLNNIIYQFINNVNNNKNNKENEIIKERCKKGYLFPIIKFSKQNDIPRIIEEEIVREINQFIKYYPISKKPNEQLNTIINIGKAIEYFLVKGIPFSSLKLNWNNKNYLILLEKIGNSLPSQYFNIIIKLKENDLSYLSIFFQFKRSFGNIKMESDCNKLLDELIAKHFIQYFKKNPLFDVQISIKNPIIGLASPFSKVIKKTIPNEIYKELLTHITANKNGLSYKILKNHPDFEQFLYKNFIHRYLYTYHHKIQVNAHTIPEKIYLMYKGKMENWNDIKDKIHYRDDKITMTGRYSQQGIIDQDIFSWPELTSFICRHLDDEKEKIKTESNLEKENNLNNNNNNDDNDNNNRNDYSNDNYSSNEETDFDSSLNEEDINNEVNNNNNNNNNINDDDDDDDDDSNNSTIFNEDFNENISISSTISNNNNNKEVLLTSINEMIQHYKEKYKIYSDIYKESLINNSKETVEKFLYYDTKMKRNQDPYEHNWGNRYLLEYSFWIISQPRLSGDHAFIKLKTPEGKVYSVGLYREFKSSLFDSIIFPLRIKPCKFISPDLSEFWKGYYNSIAIEITKEQFEKIKNKINEDQKTIQYRPYQHINYNCVTWTQEVAALANIYFPCDYPMTKLLFKNYHFQNFSRKIFRSKFLNPYYILLNKIWAFIINFLSTILGARRIDKRVKKNNYYDIKPFYTSIKDYFDINKVILMHPFIMGYHVFNYIHSWRYDQVCQLEIKLKELIEKIQQHQQHQHHHHQEFQIISNEEKNENITNDIQEIMDIKKKLENLPYSIPDKFRQKQNLPKDELYTKCPIY
ncbi:hypothetical protein BCR32DRAFT_277277 [Anaeromyces robustus]|uniref:Uncharacterized protein n=1 Tax=Anaeromyces robustus TaxID=1754192 RepID=A0A1Y1XFZ0_9FUNG|nr:hypothetical protein BCR32DRAFT_277277 [Anaeromyces robustus]|eukprot:ORX84294.1 hypothetical protein BCR32DRAFT_277277 [Anaeromyces robustus]